MSEFKCDGCGKSHWKTRSGLWKHQQNCEAYSGDAEPLQSRSIREEEEQTGESATDAPTTHSYDADDTDVKLGSPTPSSNDTDTWDNEGGAPEWTEFTFEAEEATEELPPVLKAIAKPKPKRDKRKKMTAKEKKIQGDTNVALFKMGLGAVDYGITRYGRAVMIDDSYECIHSDSDKQLVANAQWAYCQEKGIDIAASIGTGHIALALTGWYVAPPLMKIQKKSKVPLLKKRGNGIKRLLSRIPIFGRRFRDKPEWNDLLLESDEDGA